MRSGTKLLLVAAAVAIAGLANACSRDRPADGAIGPAAPLAEHTRVAGIRRDSIALIGTASAAPEGTAAALAAPAVSAKEAPFQAVVVNGSARADSVGIVATTRVLGATRRSHAFTDREGHGNEIVLTADSPRAPVRHLALSRDGQLAAEVDFDWESRAGGWVLARRTTTVYANGRPIIRAHRTIETRELAQAGSGDRVAALAVAALSSLGPKPLEAQVMWCMGADIELSFTGALVVFAGLALVAAPNPITLAGFVAAMWAFDRAVDNYLACMIT